MQAQEREDWELVAVDDGSTDETPALLRKAAASGPTHPAPLSAAPGSRCRRSMLGWPPAGRRSSRAWTPMTACTLRLSRQVAFLAAHPEVDLVGCLIECFPARRSRRVWHAMRSGSTPSSPTRRSSATSSWVAFRPPICPFRKRARDPTGWVTVTAAGPRITTCGFASSRRGPGLPGCQRSSTSGATVRTALTRTAEYTRAIPQAKDPLPLPGHSARAGAGAHLGRWTGRQGMVRLPGGGRDRDSRLRGYRPQEDWTHRQGRPVIARRICRLPAAYLCW